MRSEGNEGASPKFRLARVALLKMPLEMTSPECFQPVHKLDTEREDG